MRFEIRTGGALLILIGLAGLSGAVFALGLIAGYEMARQEHPGRQAAAVYAAPTPPPFEESQVSAMATAAVSPPVMPGGATAIAPTFVPLKPVVSDASKPPVPVALATTRPVALSTPVASIGIAPTEPVHHPAVQPKSEPASPVEVDSSSMEATTSRPKTRPYNVQVEAVMDKHGADDLVHKLQVVGYKSYIVPVDIGGQPWYRVRIGPYGTEAEARAVQFKLQKQYSGAFTTR